MMDIFTSGQCRGQLRTETSSGTALILLSTRADCRNTLAGEFLRPERFLIQIEQLKMWNMPLHGERISIPTSWE